MTMTLQLAPEFVLGEGVHLDPEDLRFGLDRGLLNAAAVVDVASREVSLGSTDPVMVDLAVLLRDELSRVPEVLESLDDPERIHDPRESARKWLYLELKALFVNRDQVRDPLGVVEQIYADFDYPPSVAPFVRYMPLREGDESGEPALVARWADFLEHERAALAGG